MLAGADPQTMLAGADPQTMLAGADPQTMLAGADPQTMLADVVRTRGYPSGRPDRHDERHRDAPGESGHSCVAHSMIRCLDWSEGAGVVRFFTCLYEH
jgi:hypothetical protein